MIPNTLFSIAAFCFLIPVPIGTLTTDGSVTVEVELPSSKAKEVTPTKDPKELAREAAIELSKEFFRNITKHFRESIAAKDFSVFTTTVGNLEEKDDLHPFRHQPKHHHEHHWGPYFDEPEGGGGVVGVRAHLASEALLNCRVGMLRDKTVMWLRKSLDRVHLLTVGATTYSGDPRVAVKFQYPNNWRLSINPVGRDDAGLYVCQVSTHPPRVLLTNVTVLAPILKIVDEQGHEVRDRYYKSGSSIELSCRVSRAFTGTLSSGSNSPLNPPAVLKQLLTVNQLATTLQPTIPTTQIVVRNESSVVVTAGVVNVTLSSVTATPQIVINSTVLVAKDNKEDKVKNNNVYGITWHKDGKLLIDKVTARNMSSTFKLLHADQKDSGSYACSILNTSTVTVQVQVLSGENQAAVHHDTLNKGYRTKVFHTSVSFFISIILLRR